jgi:hypothetical protein
MFVLAPSLNEQSQQEGEWQMSASLLMLAASATWAGSISHVGDAASVGKHDHLGSRRTSPVSNHRAAIQPIRTPTHRA